MNLGTRWVLGAVAAVACACAVGQDAFEWTERAGSFLGGPRVVVVVDSLGEQLATVGGRRSVALALEASGITPNGPAVRNWAHLSEALDAGPMEAVSRLFGSRVVIALRGPGVPLPEDWVVATAVARDDAGSVLKALGAVHRGVLAGATVFSIERGSYQLCVIKQSAAGRLLVLGPGAGAGGPAELFRDAVRGLQDPRGVAWFASPWPVNRRAVGVPGTPGGVLVRFEGQGSEPTVLSGRATDAGWSGSVVSAHSVPDDAATWSMDGARAFTDGASLGMVGSIDAASLAGSPIAPFIGLDRGAAASVLGEASRRGAIRVMTEGDRRSRIEIAVETEPQRFRQADAVMRTLVARATSRPGDAPDFAGVHPGAVRVARLGGGFSEQLGELVFGGRPAVRWRTAKAELAEHGLLRVSIASRSGGTVERDLSISELDAASGGDLVSAGRLEPGPISALIERAAGLERPLLGWTERIESITWHTVRHGEGRVRAAFEVILRDGE
ncbi:MAG: hypothetical protein AAFZ67_07975 [Planctomycetota bacterium]